MLNLLLAGVLLSGSISQAASHTTGHTSQVGGAVVGAGVTTTVSFPSNLPRRSTWQMTQGTQGLYHCTLKAGNHRSVYYVRNPMACRVGLPYLWF